MDKVYRSHSGYFDRAFGDIGDIERKMRVCLEGIEYDTMVGTGLSGTLVVPTLARTFGKMWAIIRKEYSPHSNSLIEGEIGQRWLFVDDFICSGETFQRVQNVINDIKVYDWNSSEYPTPFHTFQTECVGVFQYERDDCYAFKSY